MRVRNSKPVDNRALAAFHSWQRVAQSMALHKRTDKIKNYIDICQDHFAFRYLNSEARDCLGAQSIIVHLWQPAREREGISALRRVAFDVLRGRRTNARGFHRGPERHVETWGRSVKRRSAMRWLLALGLLLPLLVLAIRGSQGRFCVLTEDAAHGRVLARKTCTADCHNISPTELDPKRSNPGPNLQNVYMSLAGTTPAPLDPTDVYHHPLPPLAAAQEAGIVWTDENLLEYLRDPKAFLDKKTGHNFKNSMLYMPFSVREESERRSAVAYLKAIKDHPECN